MRLFGGDRVSSLMDTLKLDEDTPIENRMITNTCLLYTSGHPLRRLVRAAAAPPVPAPGLLTEDHR